jgi:TAT (twin-arginine translocation) pathway signal sequence
MTERSGMSRRQALKWGGLAAAVPLLPAVRPAKEASLSGNDSLPQQVTPAQLAPAGGEPGYVRVSRGGRRGARHMRCQLQFPSIRDRADLGGAANIISGGSHGQ